MQFHRRRQEKIAEDVKTAGATIIKNKGGKHTMVLQFQSTQ